MQTFLTGFSISISLILAIGAQNAFVLRQGLKGQYVFSVVMICAISDAILITLGVSGFHLLIDSYPGLDVTARIGGALFLLAYGLISFYSALYKRHGLDPADQKSNLSWPKVIFLCLGFTWLNPHVYLDTLVLMGAISSQYPGQEMQFTLGAVSASFIFFITLGYGAILLRPIFKKAIAWIILEAMIGLIMWSIAWHLLSGI